MIKLNLLTNNPCYTANRKINVKGLMLHSVGCPQPRAEVFVKNWNNDVGACVHAFIDGLSGDVYQTLPWNHRGWHCGGQGNNTHIGVEMCEPDCIKYTQGSTFVCSDYDRAREIALRTYDSAVDLFAKLCLEFKLNALTDIISHSEGHRMGIASAHGDCEHLWYGLGLDLSMDKFRRAVDARMREMNGNVCDDKLDSLKKPYRVLITASNLNVRSGAGMQYPVVTVVHNGDVYTIVDEQDGWGKLKSGAGWIWLGYTKVI